MDGAWTSVIARRCMETHLTRRHNPRCVRMSRTGDRSAAVPAITSPAERRTALRSDLLRASLVLVARDSLQACCAAPTSSFDVPSLWPDPVLMKRPVLGPEEWWKTMARGKWRDDVRSRSSDEMIPVSMKMASAGRGEVGEVSDPKSSCQVAKELQR